MRVLVFRGVWRRGSSLLKWFYFSLLTNIKILINFFRIFRYFRSCFPSKHHTKHKKRHKSFSNFFRHTSKYTTSNENHQHQQEKVSCFVAFHISHIGIICLLTFWYFPQTFTQQFNIICTVKLSLLSSLLFNIKCDDVFSGEERERRDDVWISLSW